MREPANVATDDLPAEARAILDEELDLLARARTALAGAQAGRPSAAERSASAERALEAQRSLREQAMSASADDLPELLLQLSLAQRLAEREPEPALPDPGSPYVAHLSLDEGRGRRDSRSAIEETVRHTLLTIAEPIERELKSIVVPEMKRAVDGRAIAEDTPEELAGTLDVEDLPVLLFLRARSAELGHPGYPHLVLDEAEDLSLFELFVLGKQLGRPPSVTLAGDEAQQTSVSFAGWETALSTLGVTDAVTCRLAVSYRCPRPIAEFARTLLGSIAPEAPVRAARDGAPIGVHRFPSEAQATLFLATALFDLMVREPRASVAVIAHDQDEARRAFSALGRVSDVRLVLDGHFSFEPGIDVTDIDSAKGLEFDYVVVPDATASAFPDTVDARRRLHVAVTRAAHPLWLIAGGEGSELLPAG